MPLHENLTHNTLDAMTKSSIRTRTNHNQPECHRGNKDGVKRLHQPMDRELTSRFSVQDGLLPFYHTQCVSLCSPIQDFWTELA